MDVSGDVADLMVKESMELTAESVKLMAAGGKNLAAFLLALAKDSKKLVGKTHMSRLLREGKELRVFRIKESDVEDFRHFARKNVLYAVVKDTRQTDGMVDLVTNVDFVSQVNLFMERRGYNIPEKAGDGEPKKDGPRARQGSSSPQRGSGSRPTQTPTRTSTTTPTTDKPSVKGRLEALKAASESMKHSAPTKGKETGKTR